MNLKRAAYAVMKTLLLFMFSSSVLEALLICLMAFLQNLHRTIFQSQFLLSFIKNIALNSVFQINMSQIWLIIIILDKSTPLFLITSGHKLPLANM